MNETIFIFDKLSKRQKGECHPFAKNKNYIKINESTNSSIIYTCKSFSCGPVM